MKYIMNPETSRWREESSKETNLVRFAEENKYYKEII